MQNSETEQTNIDLIYRYTESFLASINKSIDLLNTKLSAVAGFSGLLMKSVSDLKSDNAWGQGTRVLMCALLIWAIWECLVGLSPKKIGPTVGPKELRVDFYYEQEEDCKRLIIDTWLQGICELDKDRDKKMQRLNNAIVGFALAATTLGLATILNMF